MFECSRNLNTIIIMLYLINYHLLNNLEKRQYGVEKGRHFPHETGTKDFFNYTNTIQCFLYILWSPIIMIA